MSFLEIDNISVSYPDGAGRLKVLDSFSMTAEEGECVALVGKSGSGKTTLLRTIGGFLAPDEGEVRIGGKKVTRPGKDRLMVFQSFDQLFPWFTVEKNLLYAMKKAGVSGAEREEKANYFLKETGLSEFANSYPAALSGGMKQRAAFARALCIPGALLLMDEPFSSLDEELRGGMHTLVKDLLRREKRTVLLVTHDMQEAHALGDRIETISSMQTTRQCCP